jgi:hypothetical protein
LAGRVPTVAIARNRERLRVYKFPKSLFTRSAKLSGSSYVFRVFDQRNQVFIKGNVETGEIIKEKNISEKTNDAGISTDGILHYDSKTNSIIYVFFHSSQFICMDTNMNLKYRKPTLEMLTTPEIIVDEAGTHNTLTSTTPKRSIHGASSTCRGRLYISSKVREHNEDGNIDNSSSVIDIYNITSGENEGSFRVPGYKGEKMIRFKVFDSTIIAFYENHVVTYALPNMDHQ